MNEQENLDRYGRVPVSAPEKHREIFNRALNYAKSLGFNRSKFIVMAVIMAALDLGMDDNPNK